jgi:hypothetical protein
MTNVFGIEITAELGAIATAMAAAVAGWVGLRQYRKTERWKRAEFAIAQVHRLWNDDTIAFCCCAIDWGIGPLIIPQKYRALFPPGTETVEHDWKLMAKALRPKLHKDWNHKPTQAQFLLYRRAFDEFFSYLEALEMYRILGVVEQEELSPLKDYIAQLGKPLYWNGLWNTEIPGIAPENIFGDFIKRFYGKHVWPWVAKGTA